jgi:S-DNA-T family DNA segregation ATPase FtsK/SpoIIIE
MAARRQAASVPAETGRHILREAEALTGGAVAVFIALALLSYSPETPRDNLGGPLGHLLADTALRALGVAAYLFPVYLGLVAVALLRRSTDDLGGARLGGAVLLVCGVAALAGIVVGGKASTRGGGWLGGFLGTVLRDLMGRPGAYLVIGVALVMSVVRHWRLGVRNRRPARRLELPRVRAGSAWIAGRLRRRLKRSRRRSRSRLIRPARTARATPIRLIEPIEELPARRPEGGKFDAPAIIRERGAPEPSKGPGGSGEAGGECSG